MYVYPVGNQTWLLDRDEKRVGKYMEKERVPAPIRVSYDVRKITITRIDNDQEIDENKSLINDNNKIEILEDWLGKEINILI